MPRVRTAATIAATALLVAIFAAPSAVGAATRVATAGTPTRTSDGDPARRVAATVGEATTIPLADPPAKDLRVTGLPRGAQVVDHAIVWTPKTAGEWTVVARNGSTGTRKVAYRAGATMRRITLVSRYPARPGTIVAMGDSVAAGQGLQLTDYFGGDSCWRAGDRNYPHRLLDAWAKLHPGARAEVATVACSGYDSGDLMNAGVKGGIAGTGPATHQLPQLDWAVRANPGLVTITVGANDLRFDRPEESLHKDGTVDDTVVDGRLRAFGRNLTTVLDRLLTRTDATIVVTTYGDPAAAHPEGVANCRDACFAHAVTDIVDRLDDRILAVAAATNSNRVRVADVRGAFVGHGAPNGIGPDALRLGTQFGRTVQGASAFCAMGHPGGDPWINPIDCVHPNAAGTRAYADAVVATFQSTAT